MLPLHLCNNISAQEHFRLSKAVSKELIKSDFRLIVEQVGQHVHHSLHKLLIVQVDCVGVDASAEDIVFDGARHPKQCVV